MAVQSISRISSMLLAWLVLCDKDFMATQQVLAFSPRATSSSSRKLVKFFRSSNNNKSNLLGPPTTTDPQPRGPSSWSSTPLWAGPTLDPTPKEEEEEEEDPINNENEGRKNVRRESRFQIRRRLRNFAMRSTLVLGMATMMLSPLAPLFMRAKPAEASAPVMALPKAEDLDPGKEALKRHDKAMAKEEQEEMDAVAKRAREIEATKGPAARAKFEAEYKASKAAAAEKKEEGFKQLKRDLLDQGIDPFCDIEGQRQVLLYEKGLDLAEVGGTPFNIEKLNQEKSPKKSQKFLKAPHQDIIKLMVQDMKNRGMDPLEYFEANKEKTMALLDMPFANAVAVVTQYKANMEEFGQITKPAEGELSFKEKQEQLAKDPKAQKEALMQQKAAERAKAQAEKARLKAEAKAEKERAKAEAKAAKEEAKRAREAEKAAAAAAAVASSGAAAASAAASAGAAGTQVLQQAATLDEGPDVAGIIEDSQSESPETSASEQDTDLPTPKAPATSSYSVSGFDKLRKSIDIVPASAVLVSVGAGAYGFRMYRQKAADEEAERQRQFQLLMEGKTGESSSSSAGSAVAEVDEVEDDVLPSAKSESAPPAPAPVAPPPAPKKRRLGIFKTKKDGRETDLSVLVAPNAKAPEFAVLLGKILTFGSPGRFPNALAVLGSDMPMEEFELEKAKELLMESRVAAGLEVSESAEIFANVVNCMLIDLVDLASSSLKEKETKRTVDAVNIVVDFMNHAASLFDSVAEGATIEPVTYNGKLSKSKLEQMYSQFAVGGMMSEDGIADDFDSRVALLQDVFSINEKKAEGLMMKAMQKNMMEMMKGGGGGEGMENMMKNMGMDPSMMGDAMGGMGGLGPDGEVDPAQLKSMLMELKAAKERGEISKEELDQVRKMFKESMGTSIDELMKQAETGTDEDREVLELMKFVLDDA